MARSKVAISLDESTPNRLDRLVKKQVFPNRSQAIEERRCGETRATGEKASSTRVREARSSIREALAEEGLSEDLAEWPEY